LPDEAVQLRVEWNRTAEPLPEVTLPELIAGQARRTPAAVAVEGIDGRLTYAELDRAANSLAARLRELGAGPGSLVGLAVDRSARMVVALLGILRAGAAYVPLDPAYPRERLALMVEDSGVELILTDRASAAAVPAGSTGQARRLMLDEEDLARPAGAPTPPILGDALAYVIYTSGSTGRPKGVMLPHRALANFVLTLARRPGFAAGETLVAVTSLSFDIAGLEVYLPLVAGGRVVVASRAETLDAFALGRRISGKELGAGVLQATPSTWRMLVETGWQNPRLRAFCGGEALPPDLAAALVPRCAEVWNLYGPTETTIWSTAGRVRAGEPVSIGAPIGNTRVFVADAWGALAPVGIPGELLIGGAGLARGYRGNPAQTAERFVPDGFSGLPGERLYRTGDLARWQGAPDGSLECFGRLDHQIKVRGFRVEPGEIEAALAEHPDVRQAVVVTRPDPAGGSRLAAYVVPHPATTAAALEETPLRVFLGGRLPAYMVPSLFVFLPALPLTPNRKVDRRALPAADPAGPAPSRPPAGELEKAIAAVWAEILGVAEVGAEDSFFALGGHSLLANRVIVRLRSLFGLDLPLRALFETPTVAGLAAAVAQARQGAGRDAGLQLTARPRERHRMRRGDLEGGA
jgi:amino acid adenylation domain-containing protein